LLKEGTSMALPEVTIGFITTVVACIAIMFWISPKFAGVIIGFVTIILGVSVPFGQWLGRLSKKYQDKLGEAQTYSTEALGAMRTVQSFAAEEREVERYASKIGRPKQYPCWYPVDCQSHPTTYSYGFFKGIIESGLFTVIFGVGFGAMFVTLWYGFKLVTENEISLGELTAFQSYTFSIGGSLGQTSHFASKLIEAQGAAARIFFLLERIPEIPKPFKTSNNDSKFDNGDDDDDDDDDENPESPQNPVEFRGAVDFNNVHFSYPSRPNVAVLKDFSLSVHPNQTCAIVGSSGAGKSTVVALLQRFYDVNSGSITLDGHDIRSLDLQWLRSHIAYVQQEPQLFGLTVRENIAYGVSRHRHHPVTEQEIEAAARTANAHEFIAKFPQGYDTLVGERGVQLSGGQKQRVAIARALLINPKLLLLDEATSALDAESEHLVQEAIDNAVVGRTVLIIAHRLSTIQRADQIVVVDNHQIADICQHAELLERCSKYQELIKRQSLIGSLRRNNKRS
jgi:ABC-type multidrug transport system fused ATPase/permease subunit